jgi:hypothetical protein
MSSSEPSPASTISPFFFVMIEPKAETYEQHLTILRVRRKEGKRGTNTLYTNTKMYQPPPEGVAACLVFSLDLMVK